MEGKEEHREPLCLKFLNLDVSDEDKIKDFLFRLPVKDAVDLKVEIMRQVAYAELSLERIDFSEIRTWYQEFLAIFQHWYETKQFTEAEMDWLNQWAPNWRKKLIFLEIFDTKSKEIETTYLVVHGVQGKISLISFVVDQFLTFLNSGREIYRCVATDCKKYFIPTHRRKQKYCSKACRERARSQRRRTEGKI